MFLDQWSIRIAIHELPIVSWVTKVTMRLSVETLCVVAIRFRNSDLNSELDLETSFGANSASDFQISSFSLVTNSLTLSLPNTQSVPRHENTNATFSPVALKRNSLKLYHPTGIALCHSWHDDDLGI